MQGRNEDSYLRAKTPSPRAESKTEETSSGTRIDIPSSSKSNKTDKDKDDDEEEEVPDLGGIWRITKVYGKGYRRWLFFGVLGSMVNGVPYPMFGVLFGKIMDALYGQNIVADAQTVMILFFSIGAATLFSSYLQYAITGRYGAKLGVQIRKHYFKSLLSQEVGFHDLKNSGELNTQLISNSFQITEILGTKFGFVIQQVVTAVVGFFLAFWYAWEMTLVLMATVPVIVFIGWIQGRLFISDGSKKKQPYARAGSFSNEVFMNIRTVAASPNLVRSKKAEYSEMLAGAFIISRKSSVGVGAGIGTLMFGMFGIMYSIGLWYGSKLVDENVISVGDMFGAFFSVMTAGMALGQFGSVAEDFKKGKNAANRFWQLQERKLRMAPPLIDTPIDHGQDRLKGKIEFKNVSFAYPSAPERIVLHSISFTVEPGRTLAIVGPSGSGKSTVVALTERFYDPLAGEILVDGIPIQNYAPRYLRSQIGYVSQLPLLFAESIEENIKGGNGQLSQEDIYAAAQFADAHEFIMKLPDKYASDVGQMGGKLSGGQKQRIAIARAIVSKPCILLLDEATSALDTKSEREVQRALDKITDTKMQTSVVIAHRLSTIKNADEIIVIADGLIGERGTHESLVAQNGLYAALVRQQQLTESGEGGAELQSNYNEENNGGYGNANANTNGVEEEETATTVTAGAYDNATATADTYEATNADANEDANVNAEAEAEPEPEPEEVGNNDDANYVPEDGNKSSEAPVPPPQYAAAGPGPGPGADVEPGL